MNKFLILSFLFVSVYALAEPDVVILNSSDPQNDRNSLGIPTVLYDSDTQEIIIDGHGVVNYYDVEITSPVTNAVEISTQVDGSYDTFDISSLAPGLHVITIESPSGNIYEGTFWKTTFFSISSIYFENNKYNKYNFFTNL